MEIKNFGSLYLDGQPSELNAVYGGGAISLGDTVPEAAIPFVKWKDLWVAGKVVCLNASWDDLNKHNFIAGCPVKIDEVPYLCRSIKVGEENDGPNEWNSILDDLGEDDNLWHWRGHFFWGQEPPKRQASHRTVRGFYSARFWGSNPTVYRNTLIGFRPVLEPLPQVPTISDSLVGSRLTVYGATADISGRLIDFSDYDLSLELPTEAVSRAISAQVLRVNSWLADGRRMTIDRSAIVWMKKID